MNRFIGGKFIFYTQTHKNNQLQNYLQVFLSKLYTLPPAHAMKIFSMLNAHLERYYQKPVLLETSVVIRSSIFAWMLRLRSNANYYVGYIDDLKTNRARFSHFISIDTNELNYHLSGRQQQSQPPTLTQQSSIDGEPPTTISIKRSCKILIDCLMNENDWSVMQLVLKGLPLILQNKALFRGVDMETLAAAIIGLVAKVKKTKKKTKFKEFSSNFLQTIFSHSHSIQITNHVSIHLFRRRRSHSCPISRR